MLLYKKNTNSLSTSIIIIYFFTITCLFAYPQVDDRFAFPDDEELNSFNNFNDNNQNTNFNNNNNNFGRTTTTTTTAAPVTNNPPSSVDTSQIGVIPPEQSEAFFLCQRLCISTSEYNPVCGTNNQSYNNQWKLECANRCGNQVNRNFQRIGTRTRGTCPPETSAG